MLIVGERLLQYRAPSDSKDGYKRNYQASGDGAIAYLELIFKEFPRPPAARLDLPPGNLPLGW